jgi:allophanate hydrolase
VALPICNEKFKPKATRMNPSAKSFSHWRGLSPVEAVRTAFERLIAYNDPAMFITLRKSEDVLNDAAALQAQGPEGKPLYGLPFAVKDNIDVAGLPTTAACAEFAYTPKQSAFVVQRLQAAGAICIGKTNLDQFATGLVGVRSPYGIPRNTLRSDLIPGGSSAGSAVSVGIGAVAFSLGTDTAGSGRVPAALNGICGLKPSLGLLSAAGVVPACRTLDTISIFAAEAADAAEVAAVAQGFDAADFLSRNLPKAGVANLQPSFKVGVPLKHQLEFFDDALAAVAYAADISKLESLGGVITEIDFEPFFAVAKLLYEGPWVAERYHAVKAIIESKPEAMHPVTRGIVSNASRFNAIDTFDALYKLAALKRRVEPVLASIDMLAVPSIPTIYTIAEVEADPVRLNSNLGTYTNFVNLLDLAAFSVPVGLRSDGLPSSLTLIAKAGRDALLAGAAQALQSGEKPHSIGVAEDEVALAVVGAHLTGMPLNHELTSRNARFLQSTETTADYKLFALANTTPPKPGLLRVAEGQGVAIAIEVWALSMDAFGSFVAAIPSPLGIGTLKLKNGSVVKGFIAEAEALKDARDISSFGGWRAYIASLKT